MTLWCLWDKIAYIKDVIITMRIMAIDYGDARTGVALSDITGLLAGQTFLVKSRKEDVVLEELTALAKQQGAEELVLGYPKNMDGTLGPRAEKCAAFGERLKEATGLPVILWDERRTTVDAHRILGEQGVRSKNRKDKIDSTANLSCLKVKKRITRSSRRYWVSSLLMMSPSAANSIKK